MNKSTGILTIIFILLLLFLPNISGQDNKISSTNYIPVNDLSGTGYIKEWTVFGPFSNKISSEPFPDGSYQEGLFQDNLTDLDISEDLRWSNDDFKELVLAISKNNDLTISKSSSTEYGVVDFLKIFEPMDNKSAYALCFINSKKDEQYNFLFGSDDGAKVWVNGKLVHKKDAARGIRHREDHFSGLLNKGSNSILIKVTQYTRGWGFVLEALDQNSYKLYKTEEAMKKGRIDFLNTSIALKDRNPWNTFFTPGEFPEIEWDNRYLVENIFGIFPLKVRWFNKDQEEVTHADKPGRYACYVEGTAPDGTFIRRAKTFYCMPDDWMLWGERLKADLSYIPDPTFNRDSWDRHSDEISYYTGRIALLSMLNQQEGAVLLSYLDELDEDNIDAIEFGPIIRDHEFHLGIKRKILNYGDKWPKLETPKTSTIISAPELNAGSVAMAGFKEGTVEELDAVCNEWYHESGEPFVLLIARHGTILIHKPYGIRPDGPVTLETMTEMASTTKMLTGLLFAQFIDQGLIDLDAPIGKYFPDFPLTGEKVFTLRDCFTHTAGLWSHEEWGGVHNPWLDNSISNLLPILQIGVVHEYNGMGYDLAGKIMENVSGKSIFRLFRENFFDPLELHNTVLEEDLAFSCFSTAYDMAVVGQMVLNKGTYGKTRFFSEKTYNEILPINLAKFHPSIDVDWGIGITSMNQTHPNTGSDEFPANATLLSDKVIGHGSATSAILRIDPVNDIVISQTRRRGGKNYDQFLEKMMIVLDNNLIKK